MSAAGSGWRTSTTRASPGVDQSRATAAVLAFVRGDVETPGQLMHDHILTRPGGTGDSRLRDGMSPALAICRSWLPATFLHTAGPS